MSATEIYMRATVHIRGLEQALADGVALADDLGDTKTAAKLGASLEQLEALHGRIDRIAEPYVAAIRPLIGGGK